MAPDLEKAEPADGGLDWRAMWMGDDVGARPQDAVIKSSANGRLAGMDMALAQGAEKREKAAGGLRGYSQQLANSPIGSAV